VAHHLRGVQLLDGQGTRTSRPRNSRNSPLSLLLRYTQSLGCSAQYLAPVEELSPFKLGQIQTLIADINADAGHLVLAALDDDCSFYSCSFMETVSSADTRRGQPKERLEGREGGREGKGDRDDQCRPCSC